MRDGITIEDTDEDRYEAIRRDAERKGLPVVPPHRGDDPVVPPTNKPVGVCGECGITLYDVMHYSCRRAKCPVFVQPLL